MRKRNIRNIIDVVDWRLCIGCGACAYVCQEGKLELFDIEDQGIRPVLTGGECGSCLDCVAVCPGVGMAHPLEVGGEGFLKELSVGWGPILDVWEGYASDPKVRFQGSSGGLASALALYCIEEGGLSGVVHVGNDNVVRHRNITVFTKKKSEIIPTMGSRYSPASPCDSLNLIENAGGPCGFIGKPCDVEGLRKAQSLRPGLNEKVGVAIGIFCAGTPSTKGTLDLLAKHGIEAQDVEEIRYRGRGWPGWFAARLRCESDWRELANYKDAWGFLQKYRPYRCYLCPDSTSEFADISCGDPWYRPIDDGDPGRSVILVRTEKGRQVVEGALKAGYVQLEVVEPDVLVLSQKELLQKRGAIWGRLLTMKVFGVPAPRFAGFYLFRNWLRLSTIGKLRTIVGTARRIVARQYRRPLV